MPNDKYKTVSGDQAENEWYTCEECPFVGVVAEGWRHDRSCVSCGSKEIYPFDETIYVCTECESEYTNQADAEMCCQ